MKRKWTVIFGVLILLVVVGFAVFQLTQQPEVAVKKAELSNIKVTFTEAGVVVPFQERTVYALHTARVRELLVSEGREVSAGDLMVILDDSELSYTLQEMEAHLSSLDAEKLQLARTPGTAELQSYRNTIEEAKASLATAQQHYDRLEQLYSEGAVAKVELEEGAELVRKATYNLAQQEKALQSLYEAYEVPRGSREAIAAQRKAILARIDLVNYQLANYRITAPISGLVTHVNIEEGGIAGPQTPMLSLFQPDDYRVEARVLTSDIHDIAAGVTVNLLLELRDGDITFPGIVTAISPFAERSLSSLGLEEERVKVTITPELPRDLKVAPGYLLDVQFTIAERTNIIAVPKTALFTYEGEDALLVIADGRTEVRPVKTGLETRLEVVITEGLAEDDLFILNPELSNVAAGTRVSYSIIN